MTTKVKPIKSDPSGDRRLLTLASTIIGRAAIAARAGYSYGTARDLYSILGYPREIQFEQYLARYLRQDIANRIVKAKPSACWRQPPMINENRDEETEFEKAVTELVDKKHIWHYLARVDRLGGIGRYGVLFLGLNDAQTEQDIMLPVVSASELLYIQPYHEGNAIIKKFDTNPSSPRYGLPELYDIKTGTIDAMGASTSALRTITVHYSRVIHVAEEREDNDVFGTPRLQAVYNRLQDLELIAGGSGEMWWRGAYPGMAFNTKEGYTLDPSDYAGLEDEINEYLHGLKRYLRLDGMEVNQLTPQIGNPEGHMNVLIALISAATEIPQRLLLGSERGELASSQDRENWADRIEERRSLHVTPVIIRPFIDRMQELGIIPRVGPDGYEVEWPELYEANDTEQASVAQTRTAALAQYASTPGIEVFMPKRFYLRKYQGLSDAEIDELESESAEAMVREEEELAAETERQHAEAEYQAELEQRMRATNPQPEGGTV